ncbi:hypothetical protein MUK42_36204 [Musa troglodytarum]|uniref:Uncharacterized protein n=1 Tax=Musa troglodytarum TaxID=320322 RepID=A0A9E7E7R4_9LILI|nr:hypothetical protein MUK42_36204 [Musa troglodytarum]
MIPGASFICSSSLVNPPGSSQSKRLTRFASASSRAATAKFCPGQILRPAPNGTYRASLPVKSNAPSANLSGRNSSGDSQLLGSLPKAHAFTKTRVFLGMLYPCMLQSSNSSRGSSNGAGGCSRRTSFTTAFRYAIWLTSSSLTNPSPLPLPLLTSSCNFRIARGLRMSSAMAHSRVMYDVSVPAPNMSCTSWYRVRGLGKESSRHRCLTVPQCDKISSFVLSPLRKEERAA